MPPRPLAARPNKRKGFWYLIRRVPGEYAHLDDRTLIQISTGIRIVDDPRAVKAMREVQRLDEALHRYWQDLSVGKTSDARDNFDRALADARRHGFQYAPASSAPATLDLDDLLRRFEFLTAGKRAESTPLITAILGGAESPDLCLSDLLSDFKRVKSVELASKSVAQLERWEISRQTALDNFILATGGDRALKDLQPNHIAVYRDALRARVAAGEISADTANKAIGRVASMFRAVVDDRRLGIADVFTKMRVASARYDKRPAYEQSFIQSSLLATGALDTINEEARRIVFLMIETGLRPSEACSLKAEHIKLAGDVPYIEVRADGREIKTASSARKIPLVGVSLLAAKAQPSGFPRYWDKGDTLSAAVNKKLTALKLRPDGTSLYSLRHAFEDRLMAVGAPENIIADFMGHERARPRYGDGLTLELKRDWLARIALEPPERV